MWTEKYRPKQLHEILGHDEVVKRLNGFVKEKTIPNLLLWGPKGTGKTSLVYALASEFYGDDENLLRIECRDFIEERKKWLKADKRFKFFYDEQKSAINIFKAMIKEYASLSPLNAPFKLLFFSNADYLPVYLQQGLRRVMEQSSKTCRFIFSTTKATSVIPAIRSRCINFRFPSLAEIDAFGTLIRLISDAEGLKIAEGGLKALNGYARGDAGVAINMLEAAATNSDTIDEDGLEVVAENAFFQRRTAEELIDSAFASRNKDVRAGLEFLIRGERIDGKEILVEIHEALRRKMRAERKKSSKLFARLVLYEGEADLKLCYSLNTIIPLEEMMMKMSSQWKEV